MWVNHGDDDWNEDGFDNEKNYDHVWILVQMWHTQGWLLCGWNCDGDLNVNDIDNEKNCEQKWSYTNHENTLSKVSAF